MAVIAAVIVFIICDYFIQMAKYKNFKNFKITKKSIHDYDLVLYLIKIINSKLSYVGIRE